MHFSTMPSSRNMFFKYHVLLLKLANFIKSFSPYLLKTSLLVYPCHFILFFLKI